MTSKKADELWDDWERARDADPQLTPERFAELQNLTEDDLDQLRAAVELAEALDPPPLVALGAGDRFAGFELLSVLGKGASGIVFVALDEAGRRVAVKVLNPLTTVGPAARQSLKREVEVASRLLHPGIVGVLASGQERGYTWIATELVEDAAPIGESAVLDPIDLAIQIAEALCAAHEQGVVHRDLKPGNVLIDTAGRVRVIDFGLAQVEGAAFAISRTGVPIGTPLYMAPEQLRGEPVDPRSDLYSLGLILLEVSVGRPLDLHGGIGALARIASGQHRFPQGVLSAAPVRLRGVISRCLEPEQRHRYRDAASLLSDLRAAADGRPLPIGARPRVAVVANRVGEALWRVRRPVSALLAMLLLGWIGFWLWGPVAVDLYYTGEQVVVEIDGTRLELGSGDTLSLARGVHRFTLRSATQSGDLFALEGSFRVARQTHSVDLGGFPVELRAMDPPVPGEDWGVLVISTPDHHLRPEVYLDDEEEPTVLDRPTTQLPVTLGKHTLRIHWSGRDEVIEFEQTVDRYTAIDVVQPSYPGWRDVVIGSHRDHRVERIVAVNAAPRIWSGPPSKTASGGLTVTHTAYEQVDRERPGSVTVFIRLPSAAEHLQLLHLSHAGVGGVEVEGRGNLQTTVEMGPSTQRLVQVGYVGRGASGIDEEAWSKLSRVFQGEKTLVIRYSFGAGVDQPERALRAILPSGAGGDAATIWEPAVVFRIAQQLPHRQGVRRAMTVSTTAPGNIVGPALLLDGGQHVLADWKRGEVLLVRAGEVLASASRANVEFGKALARVGD
ncbi:MAG: serine/threonine-protein kinase, partial [Planctomycetota bacterium]|nr:serine/threonine-protein kinase [Planctomycetota bacterium]